MCIVRGLRLNSLDYHHLLFFMTYLNLFATYLPTNHKNIIFDNNFQKINDLNLGKNLTSQMVCYYTNQNDHPSHDKHVKINLSKMTKQSFDPVQMGFFLPDFLVKKIVLFYECCHLQGEEKTL